MCLTGNMPTGIPSLPLRISAQFETLLGALGLSGWSVELALVKL